MSRKSFKEKRAELERINTFYEELKDDPGVDHNSLRYRVHQMKMRVSLLYRIKYFFVKIGFVCGEILTITNKDKV